MNKRQRKKNWKKHWISAKQVVRLIRLGRMEDPLASGEIGHYRVIRFPEHDYPRKYQTLFDKPNK